VHLPMLIVQALRGTASMASKRSRFFRNQSPKRQRQCASSAKTSSPGAVCSTAQRSTRRDHAMWASAASSSRLMKS